MVDKLPASLSQTNMNFKVSFWSPITRDICDNITGLRNGRSRKPGRRKILYDNTKLNMTSCSIDTVLPFTNNSASKVQPYLVILI